MENVISMEWRLHSEVPFTYDAHVWLHISAYFTIILTTQAIAGVEVGKANRNQEYKTNGN